MNHLVIPTEPLNIRKDALWQKHSALENHDKKYRHQSFLFLRRISHKEDILQEQRRPLIKTENRIVFS